MVPEEQQDQESGSARRRRPLRTDQQNLQAILVAGIPIIVLLVVVILGVWIIRGRNNNEAARPTATHLPTLKPATLVAAGNQTPEPTTPPTAAVVAPTATATSQPASEAATPVPTDTPAPTATESAPEPTATPTPVEGLAPGGTAIVSGTAGRGLRLRDGAGLNQPTLTVLPEGTVVQILAGPTEVDGYEWFQVRDASGTEGWVASDWLAEQ